MSSTKKRLSILSESEVNDLYSVPKFTDQQRGHFFNITPQEELFVKKRRELISKAYLVLLLGYFKAKPVTLKFKLSDVRDDLRYILEKYFDAKKLPNKSLTDRQRSRIYEDVYQLLEYKAFDQKNSDLLEKHATISTSTGVEPRYVFDECIEFLSNHVIALPQYSTIQKIVSKALKIESDRVESTLSKYLTENLRISVEDFIQSREGGSKITALRRLPKDFTYKETKKELETMKVLRELYPEVKDLISKLNLSNRNIEYYASLVDYYSITKLREFELERAALFIICFINFRYRQINDNLIQAFIYHVRKLNDEAAALAKAQAFDEMASIDKKMKVAGELLNLFIDEDIGGDTPFEDVREKAFVILPKKEIPLVCNYILNSGADLDQYQWEHLDSLFRKIKLNIRPLFINLTFSSGRFSTRLMKQIEQAQQDIIDHKSIQSANTKLIRKNQRPYLLRATEPNSTDTEVDLSRFETLLYKLIYDGIESGNLNFPESQEYRSLDDDLIGDKEWENKEKIIAGIELPKIQRPPRELFAQLVDTLETKLDDVSKSIGDEDNQNVIFSDKGGKTKWTLPYTNTGTLFNNPFYERFPQVGIALLIDYVNNNTEFLSCFKHIQSKYKKSELDQNNLIACIVACGTNYGLHKMASISDRSLDRLRNTQASYMRLQNLKEANDVISNHTAKLPIFKYYNIQGDRMHASADGQKFRTRLSSFKTRYSSKYFGRSKGVSSVSLIANHVPVNAKVIGANEHESHHIFDLLFNNTSEIKPDVLSTDTAGTNAINFGLLDLFGYSFAPRYANVGNEIDKLFSIGDAEKGERLLNLKKSFNLKLMESEWDTIQRICVSLKKKQSTQSTIVRKLSSFNHNNCTMKALVEYDRLIKCIYLLNYMDDINLRQYVQRSLGRGEAYHALRRAVAHVNGNKFRGGSDTEIELWNECARLITNSIIYFNSIILSKIMRKFEKRGDESKVQEVRGCSPVAHIHINMNGTYSFSFDGNELDLEKLLDSI